MAESCGQRVQYPRSSSIALRRKRPQRLQVGLLVVGFFGAVIRQLLVAACVKRKETNYILRLTVRPFSGGRGRAAAPKRNSIRLISGGRSARQSCPRLSEGCGSFGL